MVKRKFSIDFSNASSDSTGEANFFNLFLNGTAPPTWMYINSTNQSIFVLPDSNNFAWNQTISVKFDDYISNPVFSNFTLIIYPNYPLIQLKDIPNRAVIIENYFFFDHNATDYFVDPENGTFFAYFSQKNYG